MTTFLMTLTKMLIMMIMMMLGLSAAAADVKFQMTELDDGSRSLLLAGTTLPILNMTDDIKSHNNVTKFTLYQTKTKVIDENFFSDMTNLTYLDLSDNQLDALPTKGLDKLETLILKHNNFTDLSFLSKLKKLKKLVLGGNPITEVGKDVLKENVELMYLCFKECAKLETIADSAFSKLAKLEELHLWMTGITKLEGILKGLQSLKMFSVGTKLTSPLSPTDFNQVTKLETLKLASNALKTTDITPLPNSLVSLDLSGNMIESITDTTFNKFTKLENLNLANQQKTPVTITSKAFTNSKLKTIDLQNNKMEDFSQELITALQGQNISAQLSGNEFNCTCHDVDIYKWFQDKDVPFEYPCKYPKRLEGRDLVTMTIRSLGCVEPYFVTKTTQRVHVKHPHKKPMLRCEAKSYYDKPVLTYEVKSGNPLGILNDTSPLIIRHIYWERMESHQMRYYSAISFSWDRPPKGGPRPPKPPRLEKLKGSITCIATNQWGSVNQTITPDYHIPGLLLPIWAIACITCTGAVIIMVAVVAYLCVRRKKTDSCDMIGTVNGHVRNLAV